MTVEMRGGVADTSRCNVLVSNVWNIVFGFVGDAFRFECNFSKLYRCILRLFQQRGLRKLRKLTLDLSKQ